MYFDAHYLFDTFRSRVVFALALCLLVICFVCSALAASPENLSTATTIEPETAGIVTEHGQLSVSSLGIVIDQNETTFQIQGISTHNLAWYPEYVNIDTFRKLRDDLNVNTIRLAMYTADDGGYCVSDESVRQTMLDCLTTGIEAAIKLDMYVIVDWHILSDSNPNTYKEDALSFFEKIASTYGDTPNILYEICNEPNSSTSWEDIRSYAVDVIDHIRTYAPQSIVIVGTPTWSQDVDIASQSPIDRDNLLYSLHFYAATHKEELQSKLETALANGLPVFVSEFSITEASGSSTIDTASADTWMDLLSQNNIGYVYWNLSNSDEACALFRSTCTAISNWTDDDYSTAGQWFYQNQQTRGMSLSSVGGALLKTTTETDAADTPTTLYATDDYWSFSNGCNVSVSCTGTWADDSMQYAAYDVIISNSSSSDITGWRFRITWDEEISPKEYWSCEVGGSGNNRLFIPADYNTTIPAGSSVTFGMIVYGAQTPTLTNVTFE